MAAALLHRRRRAVYRPVLIGLDVAEMFDPIENVLTIGQIKDQSVAPTFRSSARTGALGSQILSNSATTASASFGFARLRRVPRARSVRLWGKVAAGATAAAFVSGAIANKYRSGGEAWG